MNKLGANKWWARCWHASGLQIARSTCHQMETQSSQTRWNGSWQYSASTGSGLSAFSIQEHGIQITGVKLKLDRMLPADYFWQVCKFPLAYQKWRKALQIAVAPLHSLWAGPSPAGTQSCCSAANGLGAGWGHGSDGAITKHLTYVKNQAGKHPRFCICSSERGNGLKKEEVRQRNVFTPLGNSG